MAERVWVGADRDRGHSSISCQLSVPREGGGGAGRERNDSDLLHTGETQEGDLKN